MKEELIAQVTDIEAIIIQCSGCGSQVKIPIGASFGDPRNPGNKLVEILTTCPVCTLPFEKADYMKELKDVLGRYRDVTPKTISLLLKSAKSAISNIH
jgi:hypothetical protein